MSDTVRSYLENMPHFGMLPEEELDHLAEQAESRHFAKGEIMARQGETRIHHIYIIEAGQISIYDEMSGRRQLGGYIKTGEVFGGITLLMNAGISLSKSRSIGFRFSGRRSVPGQYSSKTSF